MENKYNHLPEVTLSSTKVQTIIFSYQKILEEWI